MKRTSVVLLALALGAIRLQASDALRWASSGATPTHPSPVDGSNPTSWAFAINASGTIVGYGAGLQVGFDINASGTTAGESGCIATGCSYHLNDSGHKVGSALSAGVFSAVLDTGSGYAAIGNLGGVNTDGHPWTSAADINASDYACGHSIASNGKQHAFIRAPGGAMTDLGTLVGPTGISYGDAISDDNWVAGSSTYSDGTMHAVVWQADGTPVDLGIAGHAMGINSSHQVVGWKLLSDGTERAFSWTSGGGVVLLNNGGAGRSAAYGINDSGVIVGAGW